MTRPPTLHSLLGRQPPVELLLHPMTLAALAVMILNDGWLRGAYPGWLTGKISDFAAVLAYPGIIAALWGLGAMAVDRLAGAVSRRVGTGGPPGWGVDYSLGPTVLLVACSLTGAVLAGINLWTPFRDGYLSVLSRLDVCGTFGPFHYTMDPSDLWALILIPVVWLVGRRVLARVPAGRLRAVHREAMRQANQRTDDAPEAVRAAVTRGLTDVRAAQGAAQGTPTAPDQVAPLDTLQELLVEGALQEAAPSGRGEWDVAFNPTDHYHRVLQALKTHRSRGSIS